MADKDKSKDDTFPWKNPRTNQLDHYPVDEPGIGGHVLEKARTGFNYPELEKARKSAQSSRNQRRKDSGE